MTGIPAAGTPANAVPVRLKAPLLGVVCGKCVERAGGNGRKAGKQLTRALRDRLGTKRAQAAVVGCLKLCPKRRVVVVRGDGVAHAIPADAWLPVAAALLAPGD